MSDEYVYVSVKLCLKPGQTMDSIQDIIAECGYSFSHEAIVNTEISDIIEVQLAPREDSPEFVDVWGLISD